MRKREVNSRKKKILRYQKNLYSAFIISIMIPILIIITIFFGYYNYNAIKRERQNMSSVLESTARNIETKFSELVNIGNTYYAQKNVFREAEALNNPKLYQYYDELERSSIEKEYCETFTRLIHTAIQPVRSVVFFPVDETNRYAYYLGRDRSVLTKVIYLTYHEEKWYENALDFPGEQIFCGPHIPPYMRNKDHGKVYSCVMAIRDMDNERVIGVVKIDADVKELQTEINIIGADKDSGFVLKKGEDVFFKSDFLAEDILKDTGNYETESIEIKDTGVELTYFYSKNAFYRGWVLIVIFSMLIIAGSVALSFAVYRKKGNRVVEDIRQITEVAQCIERGDLHKKIEVSSNNELQEIAQIMNKMMKNLEKYIEQEYLLVIQNQKAEYRALQAQINPHFLYNTLNGFVALNRMGEKKVLEKSIIRLSHLFRYTCKKEEITDVKSEFEFLKEYLELEKLKYEERLEYIVWLDKECEEKPIPKLLLQPIVENSIIHGMEGMEKPLLIEIAALYKRIEGIGAVMILSVRDNGCGYEFIENRDKEKHIGLENTRMRTSLFCEKAIYRCSSVKGKGTKTTFVFPVEM